MSARGKRGDILFGAGVKGELHKTKIRAGQKPEPRLTEIMTGK
jgi:hypothetical protein